MGDASALCGFPFLRWPRWLQNTSPCYNLEEICIKPGKKKPCRVAGADLTMPFGQEGLDLDVCRSQDVPRTIPSYTGLQQSAFWRCLRLQKAQPLLLNSYKHQHRGRVSLFNVVSYLDITGISFFNLPR